MTDGAEAAQRVFRQESGRILASLIRVLGDFDTAVKMATHAYRLATARAPKPRGPGGAPANPYAERIKVRLDRYFRAGRAFHGPQ